MKPKFGEKEKVLCYEPDTTKAKVLYDATIKKIEFSDRKHLYLIHFKNWNTAHDRWVGEDLILKLTDENRAKQDVLAQNLIKKSKSGQLRAIPGIDSTRNYVKKEREERGVKVKSVRERPNPDEESDESEDEKNEEDSESLQVDDDQYVPIHLDEKLVHHLEEDFVLINKKNKLLKLPTDLNVVQILENFVRHFAANMSVVPVIGTRTETESKKPVSGEMSQYTLELAMEVVDDLRILFDFMLPLILLYAPERQQYRRLRENATLTNKNQVSPTQSDPDKPQSTKIEKSRKSDEKSPQRKRTKTAEADLLDYNRKYLIREGDLKNTGIIKNEDGTRRSSRSSTVIQSKCSRGIQNAMKPPKPQSPVSTSATPSTASGAVAAQISRMTRRRQLSYDCCIDLSPKVFVRRTSLNTINMLTKPKARPDTPDRKHSSEKSEVSTGSSGSASTSVKDENVKEEYATSPKTEKNSSSIKTEEDFTPSQFNDANEIRRAISLKNIWKWRMLPQEYKPEVVPPSLIFGPQHLLRLFVKLPEILGRMKIEEKRLTMLLKFINEFLEFLVVYEKDLFSELAYEKNAEI